MRTAETSSLPASVHLERLTRRFDDVVAVDEVSLDVEPGELFGIIGPDGAGKSTLFRMLVTLLMPDSGSGTVDSLDLVTQYREIRRRVGYMPGRFSLYTDLTVEENLKFFASVFGTTIEVGYATIAPIYRALEPFRTRRAGALSGGMKQKLALSCALVHQPRLLVLDEPTTGVDAVSRVEFWDVLKQMKERGLTTIVSTPYMDEAARCDRIALMQNGKFLREPAPPTEVAGGYARPLIRLRPSGNRPATLSALRVSDAVASAEVFGEWIHVSGGVETSGSDLLRLTDDLLMQAGIPAVSIEQAQPSVEDVFIDLARETPAVAGT